MTFSGSVSDKGVSGAQETCNFGVSLQGATFEGCMLEEIVSGSEEDRTKLAHKQIDKFMY